MLDHPLVDSLSLTSRRRSGKTETALPGAAARTHSDPGPLPGTLSSQHPALSAPKRPHISAMRLFRPPAAAHSAATPPAGTQADDIQAIGDFCIAAHDQDPARLLAATDALAQRLGPRFGMADLAPAWAEMLAAAAVAAQQPAPSEADVSALREATLRMARAIDPRWSRMHPLPAQGTQFPKTGFGQLSLNGKRRKAMRFIHLASATVASKVGLASPSLRRVMQHGETQLAALRGRQPPLAALHGAPVLPAGVTPREVVLAQWPPNMLRDLRDQVLEHMDDAFVTNLKRNAKKAGGALHKLISEDDRELTHTRSQLVAEMLALDQPDSALNRALEQLAPRMLLHRPLAAMGALERSDLVLKLACETLDGIMQPTAVQAHRTAELVAELGPAGQRTFDRIHVDAMKRLQAAVSALPEGSSAKTIQKLVDRETRRTSEQIDEARNGLFKDFRRRNGGEFGFDSLSEQVRENTNIEYYKSVLLPGAVWASGARLVGAAFTVIGGPVGLALTVASAAVLQYVTAVTAQVSAGATGAAAADLKPFDSAVMPKPLVDPEVYWNQRNLGATVQKIGMDALHAYTRPGNAAAKACRATVHRLEADLGYDQKARGALSPELFALTEYHDFMMGVDAGGLDQAIPAPIRIARLLHSFADELPSLKNLMPDGSDMSEATRRTVIESLIEAIDRRSGKTPPADVATIAARARQHASDMLEKGGVDRDGFAAFMAPDASAMHAGGVDFGSLIQTLLQSSGLMEQGLFDSKGLLSAQYRGLLVNAVVGIVVQVAIGLAAFFGISALTVIGTPAAGFGAAVAFTALSFAAGFISRDAGAVSWYKKDREAQTASNVYRAMRLPDGRPMVGDHTRHLEQIEKSILANHVPLYKRRMDQLLYSLRAAWEKELVLGSARQAQLGVDMLHALENDPLEADEPRFAAELAGQSLDAMHEATSVRKHQAVIDTHEASMKLVSTTARAAQEVLRQPNAAIQETADDYLQDRERYGIRASYRYRQKNLRFFPDASGQVPARVALDKLRALARAAFDRHLQRHHDKPGFTVSEGELESLKTALRTPHADDETELWLGRIERQLRDADQLSKGDRPHHLDFSGIPQDRVAALRQRHLSQAAKVEEHQRAMRIITNDLMAQQAGRFEDIQDPLELIRRSLAHFSDAGQFSRFFRTNNDLAYIAFARGTARFAGQIFPVNIKGVIVDVIVLAGGGLAIAQGSGANFGALTFGKLDAQQIQELQAQGIELSALQLKGFQPKLGALVGPLATGLMNAMQPETNPTTFQTSAQLQSFRAGFTVDDPSFESLARASAQDRRHFQASADHWGAGLISPDSLISFLHTNAGATQLKLRLDRQLKKLPDAKHLPRQERIRWSDARKLSRRGWNTRLGTFLPSRYWHDLTYATNARHHFDQVQSDRHQLAATLVVAGHRLAAMGAPADPPLQGKLDSTCVEFASAMLHNMLLDPEAAQALFADEPPDSPAEQHAIVMQAVMRNPWYLLRLVHFAMDRLDPDDQHHQARFDNLDAFRTLLATDVLQASMPLAVRKLEHDIELCAARPMTAERLVELGADLRQSRLDVEAMPAGPEQQQLVVLVGRFAEGLAALESVDY